MIRLTRLDGDEMIVNPEQIRSIESRPDTYLTLTLGEKFIVKESAEEVLRRIVAYQRRVR